MADKKDATLPTIKVQAPNLTEMWRSTIDWFQVHYLSILIAIGAGVLIYLALAALRELGKRHRGARGFACRAEPAISPARNAG